ERGPHVLALGLELGRITNVLPDAVAAASEMDAARLDPIGAGLDEPLDRSAQRAATSGEGTRQDEIAGRRSLDEDDATVRQARAARPVRSERRHAQERAAAGRIRIVIDLALPHSAALPPASARSSLMGINRPASPRR